MWTWHDGGVNVSRACKAGREESCGGPAQAAERGGRGGGGGAMVREPQQAWSAHGDAAQGKGPGPQGDSAPIRL